MELVIGLVTVLTAGFFQGLTSFGFALIALPLLASLQPVREAVPLVVGLSLVTNALILKDCYRLVDLKRVAVLIGASLVGAPLGVGVLVMVDPSVLKLVAGSLVAAFAVFQAAGWAVPVRRERWVAVPVGMMSGFLNGSISLSGPPVALFLTNQGTGREAFRANLTAYALVLNLATLGTFAWQGLLTWPLLGRWVGYLPAVVVGVAIGVWAQSRLDEALFRRIALGLIAVSGIAVAWSALVGS